MMKRTNALYLGIEFGSTRIKSVLTGQSGEIFSVGSFTWENQYIDGYWTYGREDAIRGMQESYADLKRQYENRTGSKLTHLSGIGISGMMHGYIPTDENGEWLVRFRTWRNTTATEAAGKLTEAFGCYMPPRWSASHLYQAALDGEPHLSRVRHLFTLAGYVHFLLTDEIVTGLCEGSGMFPVSNGAYRSDLMAIFRNLYQKTGQVSDPETFFPRLLPAGSFAGALTEEGARLLDPSGELLSGVPFCPPEGDAATGMVCTDSVAPGTANVSAGTSAFLMAVLSPENEDAAKFLDHVVTPDGLPVAMIHEINCTGDINRWVRLFAGIAELTGGNSDDLYTKLFKIAENADDELGGLVNYPFFAAEPAVGVHEGFLSVNGTAGGDLTPANLMKALLCSATAPLAYGVRKLYEKGVTLDRVAGHGGFFKTPEVGAKIMSAALKAPILTYETAGEGGAYGMALLTLFAAQKEKSLPGFLQEIYAKSKCSVTEASETEMRVYDAYLSRYLSHLPCPQSNALSEWKRRVFSQNLALKSNGLVTLTWGNVSAIDRESGLVIIKPSGVPYEEMTEDDMVVVDLDGNVIEGKYRPSSDTPTHLYLYRTFPDLGGIVHTHSTYATAFAQAGRTIPCYGTTHADAFFGVIPVTRELSAEEIDSAYEHNTGKVIAETYADKDPIAVPAVLVRHHGVFTFGRTPEQAVENAVTAEEVAKMAQITESLTASPKTAPSYLQNKHYSRKHGKNAYYGQKGK